MIRDLYSQAINGLMSSDEWIIRQDHYDPKTNLQYESLFCLANGYMGTRGAHEEGTRVSIPCTYINGVFDKSETFMRELANMPNWLGIKLYIDKQLLSVDECEILEFSRALDIKKSILFKRIRLRDEYGRETLIEGLRFVSRYNIHLGAIKLYVTPINYNGILEVENIIDGSVVNFCDAPRFKVKHTALVENGSLLDDGEYIEVKTRDFGMHIGTGCKIKLFNDEGENLINNRQYGSFGEQAIEFVDCPVEEGKTIQIHKLTSFYTGRDVCEEKIKDAVLNDLSQFNYKSINEELDRHTKIYDAMWNDADIQINGDTELNRAIRFNIYHLMSTASEQDDRINIGAKLLHGEEYGGHAFWDTELFMLPFFTYVFPNTASNLVKYRYHLLDAARKNAQENGFLGAKYPWESADTGEEECPDWTIMPDGSCYPCYVAKYEHHVTADVAFGAYNYYQITNDMDYLLQYGAEIILETARFWSSRFEYNHESNRYEIFDVTGPDEWHEPVDNNCYTNYMAKWNIQVGLSLIKMLKSEHPQEYRRITAKISLHDKELELWQKVKEHVYLPKGKDGTLFEQFEGYFDLTEAIIEEYNEKDMPVRPQILKSVRLSETQLIKQADVVMLMYLLGSEFDKETQRVNYDYYEKRTMHGSSLSPSIYAIMGLRVGRTAMAYRYLRRAAFIDLLDLQKNTREGIHAANAGGVWKTVVFGFAGISINKENQLCIDPEMPPQWKEVIFKIHFHGSQLQIQVNCENEVSVELLSGKGIDIIINGKSLRVE
ncbi:glycoside hydrolase family 65 protein [Vallitalea okinawensis]|uniref:glycoside hydrolase family 65 protein n=1 Tax=Vallitalea okinawensis TaxID=2078660 RepID=UPI000CFC03C2|nr:glycosyl hydrolase family 65 protein [Vallitalea okinawensis]